MKATLVIDMPDGVSLDEWYAVTVVVDRLIATEEELKQGIPFDESKVFKFVPLRPLPKKKTEEEEKAKDPFNEDLFYDEYIWGWNACLDAITGENK